MDREEVLRMARDSGVLDWFDAETYSHLMNGGHPVGRIEKFASLVAAAERERVAREVEDWDSDGPDPRDIAAAIRALT